MTSRARSRRYTLLSLLLVAGLILASCGDDSDSEEAESAAVGSDEQSDEGEEEPSSGDDCMTIVTEAREADMASAATPLYPTESVDGSVLDGAEIWDILLYSGSPAFVRNSEGFEAAGEALGANVTVFDGKGTPAMMIQGIESAIAAGADGILLTGIDPIAIPGGLAAAQSAGIPVIAASAIEPDAEMPDGISGIVSTDSVDLGVMLAQAAAYESNCEVNALIPESPDARINVEIANAAIAELERICPETCSAEKVSVPIAEIGTKMQSSVLTALQRDPDVNTILTAIDFFNPPVQGAVSTAGADVSLFTLAPQGNLAGTDPGNIAAVGALGPNEVTGWFQMYAMAALVSGEPEIRLITGPTGILTEENWSAEDPSMPDGGDPYEGFDEVFESLWG